MTESQTGEIKIDDCDFATFDEFLRFVYYGEEPSRLRNFEVNEAMFELARRYGVEELYHLCNMQSRLAPIKDIKDWQRAATTMHDVIRQRADSLPVPNNIRVKYERDLRHQIHVQVGWMRQEGSRTTLSRCVLASL